MFDFTFDHEDERPDEHDEELESVGVNDARETRADGAHSRDGEEDDD